MENHGAIVVGMELFFCVIGARLIEKLKLKLNTEVMAKNQEKNAFLNFGTTLFFEACS